MLSSVSFFFLFIWCMLWEQGPLVICEHKYPCQSGPALFTHTLYSIFCHCFWKMKVLIRLRECAGWSRPSLPVKDIKAIFLRRVKSVWTNCHFKIQSRYRNQTLVTATAFNVIKHVLSATQRTVAAIFSQKKKKNTFPKLPYFTSKQTMKTQIRRCRTRRLIWVYTVCRSFRKFYTQ